MSPPTHACTPPQSERDVTSADAQRGACPGSAMLPTTGGGRGPSTAELRSMDYDAGVQARSPFGDENKGPAESTPTTAAAKPQAAETEGAGVDEYNQAADFVEAAGKVCGAFSYTPPAPTAAHADVYWKFWQAQWGVPERVDDPSRQQTLSLQERLDLLAEADEYTRTGPIQTVLQHFPDSGELIDELYSREYWCAEYNIANQMTSGLARRMGRATERIANGEVEAGDEEALKVVLLTTAGTLKNAAFTIARFGGGEMNQAITAAMSNAGAQAADFKVHGKTQRAAHLLGLVNGALAIYNITDPDRRREVAAKHGGPLARTVNGVGDAAAVVGGLVSLTTLLCAGVAKVAGYADDAAKLVAAGSQSIFRVGQAMAVIMMVRGTIAVFDPDSSLDERVDGMVNIGLGAAGLPAIMSRVGLQGGPATLALLLGSFEVDLILGALVAINMAPYKRGFKEATGGLVAAARPVAFEARCYVAALTAMEAVDTSTPGGAILAKYMGDEVKRAAESLKRELRNFVVALQQKSKGTPRLGHKGKPGDLPGLSAKFGNLPSLVQSELDTEGLLKAVALVTTGMQATVDGAQNLLIAYTNGWTSRD